MQNISFKDIRLVAMNLLARREHLRAELDGKLRKRFGSEVELAPVLDQLTEDKLLSDERFVEAYIRQRCGKGYGPERIKLALRQKGAAADLVSLALEGCEADWYLLAREVRLKKFGPEFPVDFAEKSRQLRFLQYRGFGGEFIAQLFSED